MYLVTWMMIVGALAFLIGVIMGTGIQDGFFLFGIGVTVSGAAILLMIARSMTFRHKR